MGLMGGVTRLLFLCAVGWVLTLPALAVQGAELEGVSGEVTDIQTYALAGSSLNHQLLKHTVILSADERGEVILERTLLNIDIVNWSNTTWYFD